jgi:hypothetical protein
MPCTSGKIGRRKMSFEESSESRKRRKSKELRKTVGLPELTQATKMSLLVDSLMMVRTDRNMEQ